MTTTDTTRAWGLHFAGLAADYEMQAKRALSLARTQPKAKRAYWVKDARGLTRAARMSARSAARHGVTRLHWPDTYKQMAAGGGNG